MWRSLGSPEESGFRRRAEEKRGTSPPIACLPGPRALQTSLFLSLGTKMTLDEDIRSSTGKGLSLGREPWMGAPPPGKWV